LAELIREFFYAKLFPHTADCRGGGRCRPSSSQTASTLYKMGGAAEKRRERCLAGIPKDKGWGGWVWIVILMATAAVAYEAAQAADSPQIPDVYSTKSAEPDRRGTAQQPLVVSKPAAELVREAADQHAHANNEIAITIATIVLAFFTVALWVANARLIGATKKAAAKQAEDTQLAIREQTRAADAMQEVAEATKNNAAVVQKIMQTQMRAYVSVRIGTATYQDARNNFASTPVITNTGLSPAKKVTTWIKAAVLDTSLPPDYKFPGPDHLEMSENDATLSPRQDFTISGIVKDRFDEEEVKAIMMGIPKRLFVWGGVTYEDVFGHSWETLFCHNFNFYKVGEEVKVGSWYFRGHNSTT
jgi:hypothetical protein